MPGSSFTSLCSFHLLPYGGRPFFTYFLTNYASFTCYNEMFRIDLTDKGEFGGGGAGLPGVIKCATVHINYRAIELEGYPIISRL